MKRRAFLAFVLLLSLVGSYFFVESCRKVPLPTKESPFLLYANGTTSLKNLYERAFLSAERSLYLHFYTASVDIPCRKGVDVRLFYDAKAGSSPPKEIACPITVPGGLMHRKLCLVDEEWLLIGSANLTPTSLSIHDNLVLGIYSPELTRFFQEMRESHTRIWVEGRTIDAYSQGALPHLLSLLNAATSSIRAALFTLTHPQLVQALIDAHRRGVHVEIVLDGYAVRGASVKAVKKLLAAGISLIASQGGGSLLHHKWAEIDSRILVMGSANWTSHAFGSNLEALVVVEGLQAPEKKVLDSAFDRAVKEGANLHGQNQLNLHSCLLTLPLDGFGREHPDRCSAA